MIKSYINQISHNKSTWAFSRIVLIKTGNYINISNSYLFPIKNKNITLKYESYIWVNHQWEQSGSYIVLSNGLFIKTHLVSLTHYNIPKPSQSMVTIYGCSLIILLSLTILKCVQCKIVQYILTNMSYIHVTIVISINIQYLIL